MKPHDDDDAFDGPFGMTEVRFYPRNLGVVPTGRPLQGEYDPSTGEMPGIVSVCVAGTPLADAYIPKEASLSHAKEAAKWLSTLVATRYDRSLDGYSFHTCS